MARRWSDSPSHDGRPHRAETPAEAVTRWTAMFRSADELADDLVADGHWTPEQAAERKALHANALDVLEDNLLSTPAAGLKHRIQPAFNPDDPSRDKPTCATCGRRIGQTRTGNGWTHLS